MSGKLKIYIGALNKNLVFEIFRSRNHCCEDLWKHKYIYAIGPFKTIRGAEFFKKFGKDNPHCRCVDDAERFSKLESQLEKVKKGGLK